MVAVAMEAGRVDKPTRQETANSTAQADPAASIANGHPKHTNGSPRQERSDSTTEAIPVAYAANNGRDKIHWSKEIWDRIDRAVHGEMLRTRVAQKFLPLRPVLPRTTSVPFDSIQIPSANNPVYSVDEGATTRLNEYWVEFSLTPQQVDHETGDPMELGHSTAATLATRAANILAQAEDTVVFQGSNGIANSPLFNELGGIPASVSKRGVPLDTGLLGLTGGQGPVVNQSTQVPNDGTQDEYGPNTFQKVAVAYALLQGKGQYGPYALVLSTKPYADTYAPVAAGLVITADRIKPLMTAGLYGSGTLPTAGLPNGAVSSGVLVSLGGNAMDLVVGLDATVAFMQQDSEGNFRFRVVERFALRLKDPSAVVRMEFL
jgi:uncharacterized linocin/CFP29 family protein